jgi:hypothetical protein
VAKGEFKMAVDPQILEEELLALPLQEQLRLARWLLDHALKTLNDAGEPSAPVTNGLLALAGRFNGGPGDSAERAELILEAEVDAMSGLSTNGPLA